MFAAQADLSEAIPIDSQAYCLRERETVRAAMHALRSLRCVGTQLCSATGTSAILNQIQFLPTGGADPRRIRLLVTSLTNLAESRIDEIEYGIANL